MTFKPILHAGAFVLSLLASTVWAAPKKAPPPPPPAAAAPATAAPAPAPTPAPTPTPAPAPAPAAQAPAPTPAAPSPAAPPAPEPFAGVQVVDTIALLPVNAPDPDLAKSATAQMAQGLRDLQLFRVLDPESISGLLGAEAMKQGIGCSDQSCLAELAGAVGAAYILSGSISRLGEDYTISVVLTDQRSASAVDGVTRTEKLLKDLGPAMRSVAQRAVQKLLAGHQGTLRLVITETGADVKVDEVLVGVTPYPPKQLAMGPHKVSVEKEGFIAFRQEVLVKPNDTVVLSGSLIPNQEYINSYKRKNILLRGASLAGVTGMAAATLMGFGLYAANVLAYVVALPENARGDLRNYVYLNPADFFVSSDKVGISPAFAPIALVLTLTTLLGFAIAPVFVLGSGVTALVTWFLSEDPGRYNQYSM